MKSIHLKTIPHSNKVLLKTKPIAPIEASYRVARIAGTCLPAGRIAPNKNKKTAHLSKSGFYFKVH